MVGYNIPYSTWIPMGVKRSRKPSFGPDFQPAFWLQGFGFIECPEAKEYFGRDVYVNKERDDFFAASPFREKFN